MGSMLSLTADDGTVIGAYRAQPQAEVRGAIVVLQEIFGVNHHIRSIADRYAALGYVAIAPALFDRVQPGLELSYDQDGIAKGMATQKATDPDLTLKDVQAAIDAVADTGPVGMVGYCWGGTLAFLAASRLSGIKAAVGYYGGGIASQLGSVPHVPVLLHFGAHDTHIPMTDVEKIRAALPSVPVFDYPAGHGFNCDERGSYHKPSADLALSRTLSFFGEHVG